MNARWTRAKGIPVAPVVLGLVLGPIVEQNFMISMIKTQWDLTQIFTRPASAVLGALTLVTWTLPLLPWVLRHLRRSGGPDMIVIESWTRD
jgi:putative tricarboxylic transport membrane protein